MKKNPLESFKVHETQFLYVSFITQQILGIVGSQIEAKKFFRVKHDKVCQRWILIFSWKVSIN
jgi:hypothetical protein